MQLISDKTTAFADAIWGAAVAVALGDDSGPVWNELVREGDHYSRSGAKRVTVTADDVRSMARNFADVVLAEGWYSLGAPIGYNHAGVKGALDADSTKSGGFITEVKVVTNEDGTLALHGLTDWTDEGRARVRGREFQGLSVEYFPAGKGRSKATGEPVNGALLFGATLTNSPFVPGMAAVAASDDSPAPADVPAPTVEPRMSTITAHLGLAEDAAEASILAEVQKRDEQIAALTTSLAEANDAKATTATALDEAMSQRDALQADKDARIEADKVALLSEFVAEGRCANTDAAQADVWKVVQALGEDKARELYRKNGEFSTQAKGHDGGKAEELADDDTADKTADSRWTATFNKTLAEGKSQAEAIALADELHGDALTTELRGA